MGLLPFMNAEFGNAELWYLKFGGQLIFWLLVRTLSQYFMVFVACRGEKICPAG